MDGPSLAQAFNDPQLLANDMVVQLQHPVYGAIHVVGTPYEFGRHKEGFQPTAPPRLGEHTDEVLSQILGVDDEEISRLHQAGII